MMNIGGFISNLKPRYRDRDQRKAVATAKGLSGLREQRVRAEGQAKIFAAAKKEKQKLASARATVKEYRRENSFVGRVAAGAKKFKKQRESGKGLFGDKAKSPILGDDSGMKSHPILGSGSSSKNLLLGAGDSSPKKKKSKKQSGSRVVINVR